MLDILAKAECRKCGTEQVIKAHKYPKDWCNKCGKTTDFKLIQLVSKNAKLTSTPFRKVV